MSSSSLESSMRGGGEDVLSSLSLRVGAVGDSCAFSGSRAGMEWGERSVWCVNVRCRWSIRRVMSM